MASENARSERVIGERSEVNAERERREAARQSHAPGIRVLVASDLKVETSTGLRTGMWLAEACRGQLILVHVVVPSDLWDAPERRSFTETAEALVDARVRGLAAQARDASASVPVSTVVELDETGDVPAAVTRVAVAEQADLIVVTSRRAAGVPGALLRSVAQGMIRVAPCPVLVVRPQGAKAEAP